MDKLGTLKSNMAKQPSTPKSKKKITKVDFEPNKVGLAVASAAIVSLVLIALIAIY